MKPILLALLSFVFFGCETEHPAEREFQKVFDAIKYDDFQSFAALHKDATNEGAYCTDEFRTVLKKTKASRSDGECERIKAVDQERVKSELPDEAQLALEIYRFVCEVPEATCSDYGRRVLKTEYDRAEWKGLTGFKVNKVIGHPEFAIVYVDLTAADGTIVHRSVKMEKHVSTWLVAGGLP